MRFLLIIGRTARITDAGRRRANAIRSQYNGDTLISAFAIMRRAAIRLPAIQFAQATCIMCMLTSWCVAILMSAFWFLIWLSSLSIAGRGARGARDDKLSVTFTL